MSIYTCPASGDSYNKQNVIYAISAVCGGGKTQAALEYIAANVHKSNFMYTVPTVKLGASVVKRLKSLNSDCDITFIHDEGAVGKVFTYLRQKHGPSGNVLILTMQCYELAHRIHDIFKKLKSFQLIVDEIPSLASAKFFNIDPKYFIYLRELVEPLKEHITDGVRLIAVDGKKIEKLLKNGKIPKECEKFFRYLINGNFHTFVNNDDWDSMLKHKRRKNVDVVAMLNPKPFKGAIMMGANLEHSLIYDWFSRYYGYRFLHNHPINESVQKNHDPRLTDLVTVKYPRQKNFSKYIIDGAGDINPITGNLNIDDITDLIKADMVATGSNGKYGFTANASFQDESAYHDQSLATADNAVYIPPKAHGLNQYDYLNTMVFLCAMNPTPEQQTLMGSLGFSYDQLRHDMMIDPAYQWFLRSSARKKLPTDKCVFYAPDSATAFAVRAFTGASIEFIGGDVFPYEEPQSDKERQDKSRNNKFLLEYQIDSDKNCHDSLIKYFSKEERDTFCMNEDYLPSHYVHLGVCHRNESYKRSHIMDATWDRSTWVSHMKKFAKVPTNKKEAYKIIPSWFHRDHGEYNFRKKNNVLATHSMILDIDGGSFTYDDFIAKYGKKFCFLIYSTANCGTEKNRYRVVLPYLKPCGIEEHKVVYDWFVRELPNAKIDESSGSGAGVFTLPFTGESGKPFIEFCSLKRDSDMKKRIDPFDIARKAMAQSPVYALPESNSKRSLDVQALISEVKNMNEDRRTPFFSIMRKMDCAGYSDGQIRSELTLLESEMGKSGWIDEGLKQIKRYDMAA